MNIFQLKVARIFVKIGIPLQRISFLLKKKNPDDIIFYIFSHLNREEATIFYTEFVNVFKENAMFLLKPHFITVIQSIDLVESYIVSCYQILGSEFLYSKLDELSIYLTLTQYNSVMIALHSSHPNSKIISTLSPILYPFYEAIETSKKMSPLYFAHSVLLPMTNAKADEYLSTIFNPLFLGKSLEVKYLKKGTSSFAFDVNGKVIKFGYRRSQFPLIMHYRINDFYVRKRLQLKNRFIDFEISPKGNVEAITERDIKDALNDLNMANIVVNDYNYFSNFALFDQEEPLYFQDVDGIIEYRNMEYSKSYQKRKVKLIDHEYIYDKNDSNQLWGKK